MCLMLFPSFPYHFQVPDAISLGPQQEAHVWGVLGQAGTVVFLANIALEDTAVLFNGYSFNLPAWSVSIVDGVQPNPTAVIFNTAQIELPPLERNSRILPTGEYFGVESEFIPLFS
jgi:hypothetical protein